MPHVRGHEFTTVLNSLVAYVVSCKKTVASTYELNDIHNLMFAAIAEVIISEIKWNADISSADRAQAELWVTFIIGSRNFGLQNYNIELQPSRMVPALIYVKTVLLLKTNYKCLIASFANFYIYYRLPTVCLFKDYSSVWRCSLLKILEVSVDL